MSLVISITVDGHKELIARSRVVRVIAGRPASTFVDALPTRVVLDNGAIIAVEESVESLESAINNEERWAHG